MRKGVLHFNARAGRSAYRSGRFGVGGLLTPGFRLRRADTAIQLASVDLHLPFDLHPETPTALPRRAPAILDRCVIPSIIGPP